MKSIQSVTARCRTYVGLFAVALLFVTAPARALTPTEDQSLEYGTPVGGDCSILNEAAC